MINKQNINRDWYPMKVSNYKIIGDYETADISFTWSCDGPFNWIQWTRKCFRKNNDVWRSIVDGSTTCSQWNINSIIDDIKESIKETQESDIFMEYSCKHLK